MLVWSTNLLYWLMSSKVSKLEPSVMIQMYSHAHMAGDPALRGYISKVAAVGCACAQEDGMTDQRTHNT